MRKAWSHRHHQHLIIIIVVVVVGVIITVVIVIIITSSSSSYSPGVREQHFSAVTMQLISVTGPSDG